MKKTNFTCNHKLLHRYLDKELGPDQASFMDKHLAECLSCQQVLQDNQAIGRLFRTKVDEEVSRVNLQAIETRVVAALEAQRVPWWSKLQDVLATKRFYVPATAIVAAMVLLGVFLTPSSSVSGPSAIISSLKADVGSVMILETPDTHQTVIWFNEPVSTDEQNGPHQPEGNAILGFPTKQFQIA